MQTNNSSFFDESTEQSKIKSHIVADYFSTWAKIIIPTSKKMTGKIGYIDLFAGPGRYKDGTKSTPLLILEEALADVNMRNMIITIFSDAIPENIKSLDTAINAMPNIGLLKHKPRIYTEIVDEKIVEIFSSIKMIPCLTFLDPWGYKGLSNNLINSVIKDFGCDCIIFFNYNRINMGLNNDIVRYHMDALFGNERVTILRHIPESLSPEERETVILNALSDSFKEKYGKYVLPFRFRSERGGRISHHLVFVTKHKKGYDIMKSIMAKASSENYQGVPSFEFSPIVNNQPLLFDIYTPLDELKNTLLEIFAGKSISVLELYDIHNLGTNYIKRNYKEVLKQLEKEGNTTTFPTSENRKKNTMADDVLVTFPAKKGGIR
jgi:three-Cys-motif partner protein